MARTSKKKPPRPARTRDDRGEYRSIYTVLPDSPEFRALSPHARSVIYPLKLKLGRAGIDVFYLEGLRRVSGWASDIIDECVRELIESRWIIVEEDVVWMRNALRFEPSNPLGSPNGRKGVINHLLTLPKLHIVNEFVEYYGLGNEWNAAQSQEAPTRPPSKPIGSPFEGGGSAGMRDEGKGIQKEKPLSGPKENGQSRACQLPASWQPNEQHRSLALELRVDLEFEVEQFRDHAAATGRTLKDWDAGFRTWLRRAKPNSRASHREEQDEAEYAGFVDKLQGELR